MLVPVDPAALIRTARRRAGLTQGELAARAGTSQPVVSAYEHGHRQPALETLRRLVEAAGQRVRLDAVAPVGDLAPPVDLAEHGRRLLDVLSLADAIPSRRRPDRLTAPRLTTRLITQ